MVDLIVYGTSQPSQREVKHIFCQVPMTQNPKDWEFDPLASGIKVTYSIKHLPCSNSECLICMTGKGHGPYWYAQYELDGTKKNVFLGRRFKPLDLAKLIQRNINNLSSDKEKQMPKSTHHLQDRFKPMPTLGEFEKDLKTLKAALHSASLKLYYRKLIKKYHPDQFAGNPQMDRWMSEINGTYRHLTTQPSA